MLILEILKFRINSGNAEKSRNFAKKANRGKVLKGGSLSGFTTTLSLEINFQYFGKFRKKTGDFFWKFSKIGKFINF